jgi:hypothetical protein
MQETYSLNALHRMKYQIRDRLQQNLDAHYVRWAEGSYERRDDTHRAFLDLG